MSRYVTDPETGLPYTGDEASENRRLEMARQYEEDEQTNNYYDARQEARNEMLAKIKDLPIGNSKLVSKIYQDYFEQLELIDNSPQFELAVRKSYLGWKPNEMVYENIQDRYWRQLEATYPNKEPNETYAAYEKRVQDWEASIPVLGEQLIGLIEISFTNKIIESGVRVEERLKELPIWIAQLKKQSSAAGHVEWKKQNDTPLEAVWEAYQELYLQAYYDTVKDKSGAERTLAELEFYKAYPTEPNANQIFAWVQELYGNKYTYDQIASEVTGMNYATPEDIANTGKTEIDKSADRVWDIIASLGPSSNNPTYSAFMDAYSKLGGDDSDWDIFWALGGDPNNYGDIETYTEFLRKVELAAQKIELQKPTEEQLREFVQAKQENTGFTNLITMTYGDDFYDEMGYYYRLSTDERKDYRKQNPDEYYEISQYYTMKDQYAMKYPVWAKYYHPEFDKVTVASGSGTKSGTTGSTNYYGGSSSGKGYSASYNEYASSILYGTATMGKRSTLSSMELFGTKLGKGGVTKKPWWPQELLNKLHEKLLAQIKAGYVTQAGINYLQNVAQDNPEYAKVIRNNIKSLEVVTPEDALTRGTHARDTLEYY